MSQLFISSKKNFDQHLLDSITVGDNEAAKSTIENLNLYREIDLEGRTLLHHAALLGNSEITRYLVDKGCDLNAQDSQGCTALITALKNNTDQRYHEYRQVIIILLESRADVFIVNNEKQSPIYLMFDDNWNLWNLSAMDFVRTNFQQYPSSDEVAKKLMDAGFSAVHKAIYLKDTRIVEYMLERGQPIHNSSIHVAMSFKNLEILKLLIKYGVNVNALYVNATPISSLYHHGFFQNLKNPIQIEFLKVFLEAGALPFSFSQLNGMLDCTLILKNGPREAIRLLLLQPCPDFTSEDRNGRNALYYLAENTNPGIVEELEVYFANNKLNVNVKDIQGLNPLHVAAYHGNVDMLKFLLKQGADVNSGDNQIKVTPLFYAYLSSAPEHLSDQCVEILLQHNADPQFVHDSGRNQCTVFKVAMTEKNNKRHERLKPVLARLAMLEKSGIPIIKKVESHINAEPMLKKYFKQCQRLLSKTIADNVTVFKLLNVNKRQMAKYLNNRILLMKLTQLNFKLKIKFSYSYYYNTIEKRFPKAFLYKTLHNKASAIINQLSKHHFDESHIVVDKVIGYLDEQDMRILYKIE